MGGEASVSLAREIDRARAVLFSDLDGTLIDGRTFEPGAGVEAAVAALRRDGILLVPVTSKTAAEVERLWTVLDLPRLAVVEGGAVLLSGTGPAEILGPPREALIGILRMLQEEGWPLTGLSQMDAATVSRVTGLGGAAAARALQRSGSEPFVIDPGARVDEAALRRRIEELGAVVVRGDRLWHLLGAGVGKGAAVGLLEKRFPALARIPAGAVGDAWNDLDMLCAVAHGFLLGGLVADEDVPCPLARIPEPGPPGFLKAVELFRRRLGL